MIYCDNVRLHLILQYSVVELLCQLLGLNVLDKTRNQAAEKTTITKISLNSPAFI